MTCTPSPRPPWSQWLMNLMLRDATAFMGRSPETSPTGSLDHLIGEREQRRRDFEAERLGGLHVERQLELGGLRDRQFGRLLALENPSGVVARLAKRIGDAGGIAHQPARHHGLGTRIYCRHRMAGGEPDDP